ncbi:hypothetical protein FUAX_02300 [Fulvitalea axinellae]|uniref:Hydrolase n=1 Tax=Fulvitalea axinellae TaxID=1182444 RepID=A0AAU9CDE9_9BACT|nr:hypothetical protein FUAX_02300 [Fulvitalea axinellae]
MRFFSLILTALLYCQVAFGQGPEIKWWNPAQADFPAVMGQAWPSEVQSTYHRLPARAEKEVRKPVWKLSRESAGLSIRFHTNASDIRVRYKLKGPVALRHMPSTGVSGLDLFAKSADGEWLRCWGSYSIGADSRFNFVINEKSRKYEKRGREYRLFLPLYNEVDSLVIGVSAEADFRPIPAKMEKPIVAYGTSICQGACVSRPGMTWTNILERQLDRPMVNLGFSGNGRLEPELIELIGEIEASLYILDCLPNLKPKSDDTEALAIAAVKRLRELRPDTPIILTEHIGYADGETNRKSKEKYISLNKALRKAYKHLKRKGYTKVYLLSKTELGLGIESYVDTIHPNDHGMLQYADAYEKLIRKALVQEGQSPSL